MTNDYLKMAEEDTLAEILVWVQEVVEGRGESLSQMVVSVVLGCVPGVGQAVDVYNILRAIHRLTKDSDEADNWMELVLSLVAVIPGFGDALKNAFRMLRNGRAMARILDSLPTTVRGNIEKWFRELDWPAYTRELITNTNKIISGIVGLLDTYAARWILDKRGLQELRGRLNAIKAKAQQKISEAMSTLEAAHMHAMAQPLPNTTAHVPARAHAPARPAPGSRAPAPRNHELPANTGGTAAPRQGQANAQQRQSEKSSRSRHQLGVSGEHIADYYFSRRQKSRQKINAHGLLYEMQQPDGASVAGHKGIDHVWHSTRLPLPYRISDTKGTGKSSHKLETPKQVFDALRYGVDVYLGEEDEKQLKRALNKPTISDGRQLSHLWISRKINGAGLLPEHETLLDKIEAWESAEFKLGTTVSFESETLQKQLARCPYDRSLITVVGPNHNLHDRSKGRVAPCCGKGAVSHQIGTEFVIPTHMLRE
ncbi:hypothetical protein [Azoarcus indigens]|uniref:Uncharacterized protein n=1 Tax=Azoarcus indigens TaxID=29545 RepID=A0A4R6DCU6_9RHOO|nr:hypothetical protein [Azoarcus indigens]TDN42345.1 hypothetical protein C7389_1532 [Azoarcus indigens]